MAGFRALGCGVALAVLGAASSGAAQRHEANEAGLTTKVKKTSPPPIALHWELLRLPERVLALAVSPLRPVVGWVERYRIDRRIYDLLTNDAETIFMLPYVDFRGTDGFSGGALFRHKDLFGGDEQIDLTAALQGNLDYRVRGRYKQRIALLDGRKLELGGSYRVDRDVRFFGIGGQSREQDERVYRRDELMAMLAIGVFGPERAELQGRLALRFFRTATDVGERLGVPSVDPDDPRLSGPPGFGETVNLPVVELRAAYDTRDSRSAPSRGWLVELDLAAMHDLDEHVMQSAVSATARAAVVIELLARRRVLVLGAGAGAATALSDDDEIPLQGYVRLGRDAHLRGYKRDRFLDRYAWWASAEYRYPFADFVARAASIYASLFVDVARAGADAEALFGEPPRWSAGFGLFVASLSNRVASLQLAFSPEGYEFTFAAGDIF